MTTLLVTYPMSDGVRFDGSYYIDRHMAIVRENWGQYGLRSAKALMPDETAPPFAAVAMLEFADGPALEAALASPEAATVFGDLANFTDIAPVAFRCEAR